MMAMLAHGVKIQHEPLDLMNGMIEYLNNAGRDWYATGDEDGVILHNKFEEPLLVCIYDGSILSFRSLAIEDISKPEYAFDIKTMLINIVGYITSISDSCNPVGHSPIVGEEVTTDVQDDDWSI